MPVPTPAEVATAIVVGMVEEGPLWREDLDDEARRLASMSAGDATQRSSELVAVLAETCAHVVQLAVMLIYQERGLATPGESTAIVALRNEIRSVAIAIVRESMQRPSARLT